MTDWPKYNAGRHHVNRHGHVDCQRCLGCCIPDNPCRCCETARANEAEAENAILRKVADQQMAENETLRATVERWAESVEHTQCGQSGEPQCECCYDVMPVRAENDALRATIARVRGTVARHQRIYAGSRDDGVPVQVILQALDGER